jgi:hypothetical protein
MSSTNTALALEFRSRALAGAAPSVRASEATTASLRAAEVDESAQDWSRAVEWFADLTWGQVVPIATIMLTFAAGVLICGQMLLAAG